MKRMAAVDMFDIPLDLPRFDVRMLWHSRTQNSPAHAWFRELVLECLSPKPRPDEAPSFDLARRRLALHLRS